MPQYWRVAGLSYLKFSMIAGETLRSVCKPEM